MKIISLPFKFKELPILCGNRNGVIASLRLPDAMKHPGRISLRAVWMVSIFKMVVKDKFIQRFKIKN